MFGRKNDLISTRFADNFLSKSEGGDRNRHFKNDSDQLT